MLWENPSYDGDHADALDLEQEEKYMCEELTTSVKSRNPERQSSRGDDHGGPEFHKIRHTQGQPSYYLKETTPLEEWLQQEHRHECLWRLKQGKT